MVGPISCSSRKESWESPLDHRPEPEPGADSPSHSESWAEFGNSLSAPQSLHTPLLVAPCGLSITQWWRHCGVERTLFSWTADSRVILDHPLSSRLSPRISLPRTLKIALFSPRVKLSTV